MIRALGAAVLAVHGLIHLIGFVVPWRIAAVDGFPYRVTALGGAVALGQTGALVVGVAWLVLALGFLVAALATWRRRAWAPGLTAVLAVGSMVVCTLGVPEAIAGIAVNVGILLVLARAAFVRGGAVAVPARNA